MLFRGPLERFGRPVLCARGGPAYNHRPMPRREPTRTKIVVTVGPSCRSRAVVERIIEHGVDVVRFNLSHGDHQQHNEALRTVREVAGRRGAFVATMADLCGPKVRTGVVNPNHAALTPGSTCVIVPEPVVGTAERFSTNYPGLVAEVEVGHRVLIDDGQIHLRVLEKRAGELACACEAGGTLGSGKGINVPDSNLSLPALSEKDHDDLGWAIENGLDYVALSFVRKPEDLEQLRSRLREARADIPIIAKMETPQAIGALDAIIASADAVLVARGDLGVEMDVWRIPMLQKRIVHQCRRMGKPAIIATQMLQSMVDHRTPTRAEVTDVANSVLDGADAVMLSAETAVGSYPVEAVRMLGLITGEAEASRVDGADESRPGFLDERMRVGHAVDKTTAAVARSAALVAHDVGARLIAVWCQSGRTARWISKYQLPQILVGLSASDVMCRRLALSYGVEPMAVSPEFAAGTGPVDELQRRLAERHGLEKGDIFIVVGDPTARKRRSTLSIHVVGD